MNLPYVSAGGVGWAFSQFRRLEANAQKILLLVMASHFDETGTWDISMKRLAEAAGMDRRAAQKAAHELSDLDVIDIQTGRGRWQCNRYRALRWSPAEGHHPETPFVSSDGVRWAIRQFPQVQTNAQKILLAAIAAHFDTDGTWDIAISRLSEVAAFSRGATKRVAHELRDLKIIDIQTGEGRWRTNRYQAHRWRDADPGSSPSRRQPRTQGALDLDSALRSGGERPESNRPADLARARTRGRPGERLATTPDRTRRSAQIDITNQSTDKRKVAACAASPAAPSPSPDPVGPAEASPVGNALPTPQAMLEVWNATVAGTPLPLALMTPRRAGQLARVVRHPAVGSLQAWEQIVRWVSQQPFYRGDREGGWPSTVEQVATVEMVEQASAAVNKPPPPRDWSNVPITEPGPEDVMVEQEPIDDAEMQRLCNPFADLGSSYAEFMARPPCGASVEAWNNRHKLFAAQE